VLNTLTGFETYYFLDGYSRYHQIFIASKDRYNNAFVTDWGAFIWKVMPFGVKNGPPTYHRIVTQTFRKYLDSFMKIFLDDFIIYSDMESHLQKLRLCSQKCRKYGINMNLNKFAFMVFSRMILGFIVPKEGKLLYPKKV
jgi:hypothetical protein